MMRNKFPLFKILILVTILALPGFLYYLLQSKGKNRYKPLAVYGPKKVADTFTKRKGELIPDTIFHKIKPFEGINQDGEKFVLSNLSEEIIIVNFFYTKSKDFGPIIYQNLEYLVKQFIRNKKVKFISISVDPKNDNPKTLKDFANKFNAIPGKWDFISIEKDSIESLAKEQFFVNAIVKNDQLIYSEKVILLDSSHRIRGYADARSSTEMKDLANEVRLLMTEELREHSPEL